MFITNIMTGMMTAKSRLTWTETSIRSRFAASKRRFSSSTRLKARMTRMPVSPSRSTRLILSIFFWMDLKSGKPLTATVTMMPVRTGITTTMTHESPRSFETAMMMPPIIMIGALTIILIMRRTTICTWVTSFVVRVTRLGVPILSNSWSEKAETCVKMSSRMSAPMPMAECEER